MSFCWDLDTLQTARRLYLEIGLSASESAKRLGTTRSALIAKAHRMGWAEERDPALAAANQNRVNRGLARALRPDRLPRAAPPRLVRPAAESRPKHWMDREAGECAFPVAGDGEDLVSCCAPSGEWTYCETHTAAMYVHRTDAQQKALGRLADWVDQLAKPRLKAAAR